MKVKSTDTVSVQGILETTRESDSKLIVKHYNADDSYYHYEYLVKGTKKEIDIVEEFCKNLTAIYEND